MDDLAIYRYTIGSYYDRVSYKSSVGRSLKRVIQSNPCRSTNPTKRKYKHCKMFSNHKHKCLQHRYRSTNFQFKFLPVLAILLITTFVNQYGTSTSEKYRMMSQTEIPVYYQENNRFYTQKIADIPASVDGIESFEINAKNISYLYYHTCMDGENNHCKKYRNLYRELYSSRMFLTQFIHVFSGSLLVHYPWQRDDVDQAGSNSFLRKNQTAALKSNYECSKLGTGTCYYLLGNKGMHMSNGNPQTKLSPGEAHFTKQSRNLIKNNVEESIGYITTGEGSGTGFRVCDTYLMSAFHVFSNKIDDLVSQILFQLGIIGKIPNDVVLSRIKDALEVDINVDGAEDFVCTARCMLKSFLEQTAYDTEKLVARLKEIIDTEPLRTRLKEEWKNCLVDFISHGRFCVDWKIIFGSREIDIIIVDLYPTGKYQDYPKGMLLDERYRQHGSIQLIRYIRDELNNKPKIIIDQSCNVFSSDIHLQKAVDEAIEWWVRNFPKEDEAFFRAGYKDCCKAIDKKTGRVILKSSESFEKGSSGSPIIYMMNKDGVPVVEMIYLGGFPPFYYTQGAQRFKHLNIDRNCFFGRGTTMKRLAHSLNYFKKTGLKRVLFSSECLQDPRGIRREDAMTVNVKAWEEVDRHFYNTKVSKIILNKISDDEYHSVSVIGVPGSGKTAAIRHAALHLRDEKGFTIYPILEPTTFAEKFNRYFCQDIKQVFVFDDPAGSYSVDMNLLKLWDYHSEGIEYCLNENTKFLFSLRTQVDQHTHLKYNSYVFNMKSRVIDLMSSTYSLDIDDMKGMLRCLLKKKGLPFRESIFSSVTIDPNDALFGSFPLQCKVFCEEPSLRKNPAQFFKNPFSALVNIFKKIKSHNKHQFCGLLMCAVLEERSVSSAYFTSDIAETNKKLLRNAVLLEMNLTEKDLKNVQRELQAIDNVFVKYIGTHINFIHSIFKDIVIFLNENQEFVFRYGSSQLITERVRMNSPLPDEDQFVLVCDKRYYILLAERLIQDFFKDPTSGFSFIANSSMMDNEEFFNHIEKKLFSTQDFFKRINENSFFLDESVSSGNIKLTRHLLKKLGNISGVELILHSACRAPSNNFELIKLLVNHGAGLNQLTKLSESVLNYVTRYTNKSNVEISKYFLQNGISAQILNSQNESILHYTAKYGGGNVTKLAELFIQHGANPNIANEEGKSILHYTVSYETEDNIKLAELFIHHGTSVNVVDNEKRSLLHYTARYYTENDIKLAKLFIDNGASLNVADKEGQSLLHYTALYKRENNIKLAELFIEHGASVNDVDEEERTVLHYVSSYQTEKSVKLAELFIRLGAALNVVDKEGQSLLHYTICYEDENSVKLAKLFIQHGAEINVVDKDGMSLLYYTVLYNTQNSVKLAQLFMQNGAEVNVMDKKGHNLLHYTVFYEDENRLKLAELFIRHGASVNVVDEEGLSLLHYTVYYEGEYSLKLAELFMQHGASANVVDKNEQSLLHYTARYYTENKLNLAELFINYGASVSGVDKDGQNLFHYIARFNTENNVKLAELFVHHGTSVNIKDKEGQSLLHYTGRYNTEKNLKLAELFIHHGASVNVLNEERQSVLHYAARYNTENSVKIAALFVRHGASVNAADKEGQSLLHYTARYNTENNVTLAELFIHHGASVNAVDKEGQSLLHYTTRFNTENNVTLAKRFIHHGASVNAVDKEEQSLLHYTSRYNTENNFTLAELFIHHGASVHVIDKRRQSLLHYTTCYNTSNNVKLAKLFFQHGISVIIGQSSLLHFTASYQPENSVKLAELLIHHGASVNVVDMKGRSILHYTVCFEDGYSVKLAELFIQHGASVNVVDKEGQCLLHYTTYYKNPNSVKLSELFINHGTSVNVLDKDGRSLLHYITRYNTKDSVDLAELFIRHGASVNVVDREGQSLLHYTVRYYTEQSVKLANIFIQHLASVNLVDKAGQYLLHYSSRCKEDNLALAELCIDHGASVNAMDADGRSLLHYTIIYKTKNSVKLAEKLIYHGASVNAVDKEGQSLLHYTTRYNTENNVTLAELFIHHGASVNVVDKEEQSLLHYATRYNTENKVTLAELFIHHGASVNAVDKEGQSLLHYATRYNTENKVTLAELFIHHGASVNAVDKEEQPLVL